MYCYRSLKEESTVHVYDGRGDSQPLHVFATLHSKPCTFIKVRLLLIIDMSYMHM